MSCGKEGLVWKAFRWPRNAPTDYQVKLRATAHEAAKWALGILQRENYPDSEWDCLTPRMEITTVDEGDDAYTAIAWQRRFRHRSDAPPRTRDV